MARSLGLLLLGHHGHIGLYRATPPRYAAAPKKFEKSEKSGALGGGGEGVHFFCEARLLENMVFMSDGRGLGVLPA